jgi:hypothetical protein
LKIAGIWETDTEFGLTYKFINIWSTLSRIKSQYYAYCYNNQKINNTK